MDEKVVKLLSILCSQMAISNQCLCGIYSELAENEKTFDTIKILMTENNKTMDWVNDVLGGDKT